MAGKALLLHVFVRVFLEETDVCVSGLREEDPPSLWVHTSNWLGPQLGENRWKKGDSHLALVPSPSLPSEVGHFFFPPALGHHTASFLAFGLWDLH